MPPASRNQRTPTAGETPAEIAAASLGSAAAILALNRLRSSRLATVGRPGDRSGLLPDRSELRLRPIAIATASLAVLRRPVESAQSSSAPQLAGPPHPFEIRRRCTPGGFVLPHPHGRGCQEMIGPGMGVTSIRPPHRSIIAWPRRWGTAHEICACSRRIRVTSKRGTRQKSSGAKRGVSTTPPLLDEFERGGLSLGPTVQAPRPRLGPPGRSHRPFPFVPAVPSLRGSLPRSTTRSLELVRLPGGCYAPLFPAGAVRSLDFRPPGREVSRGTAPDGALASARRDCDRFVRARSLPRHSN